MNTQDKLFISESVSDSRIAVFDRQELVNFFRDIDYSAYCLGVSEDIPEKHHKFFKGSRIVILTTTDEIYAKHIFHKIPPFVHSITLLRTDHDLKKSDYDNHKFKQLVENIGEVYYAPWVSVDKKGIEKINADIMAKELLKQIHFFRLSQPNEEKELIYIYKNGFYELCNKISFKSTIKSYIPLGMANDKLLNEVYNLLLASDGKYYTYDEINSDENIINFKNGVYDITNKRFITHTPENLCTIQLNCEYNESAPKPNIFLKFMNDLCTDEDGNIDNDKIAVIQEWMGLLLSNIPVYRVKSSLLLYSALGNTGKSQLLGIIGNIIGFENTINIPIQNLSERFSVGSIFGKRLIMVGDQESGDIENSSIFKQLTGGDPVSAEKKGKQPFSFVFNGGIIMACNGLPSFVDDKGGHVFERLHIVPLTNSIPKDKQDSQILQKMLKEKDSIFQWALQGLHRLIDNGYKFSHCNACNEIMTKFRSESDTLYSFIHANYEITENRTDKVKRSEFHTDYSNWCMKMDLTPLNKRNIPDRALKNGLGFAKHHGYDCYTGIKIKADKFINITIPEEEKPFK